MSKVKVELIPSSKAEREAHQASKDRSAYLSGKHDAIMKLNRDPVVQYSNKRDIDCYNMGYSYGETL